MCRNQHAHTDTQAVIINRRKAGQVSCRCTECGSDKEEYYYYCSVVVVALLLYKVPELCGEVLSQFLGLATLSHTLPASTSSLAY